MKEIIFYYPEGRKYLKTDVRSNEQIIKFIMKIVLMIGDDHIFIEIKNDRILTEMLVLELNKEVQDVGIGTRDKMYLVNNLLIESLYSLDKNLVAFNLMLLDVCDVEKNIIDSCIEKRIIKGTIFFYMFKNIYIINNEIESNIIQKLLIDKFNFKSLDNIDVFLQNIKKKSVVKKTVLNKKIKKKLSSFDFYEIYSEKNKHLLEKLKDCEDEEECNITIFDNNFKIEEFFFWLFSFSFERVEIFLSDLDEECKQLKKLYLKEIDTKTFFLRISMFEELKFSARREIKMKKKFISGILRGLDKTKLIVPKIFYSVDEDKINDFDKHFTIYLQHMRGRLKEYKVVLESLDSSIKMMKKTFRIILDDKIVNIDKYINKIILYTVIITAILSPFTSIPMVLAMNITTPISGYDNNIVFYMVLLFLSVLSLSQYIAIKKYR